MMQKGDRGILDVLNSGGSELCSIGSKSLVSFYFRPWCWRYFF